MEAPPYELGTVYGAPLLPLGIGGFAALMGCYGL